MTRLGIEPRSPGPLANTLTIIPEDEVKSPNILKDKKYEGFISSSGTLYSQNRYQ